MRDDDIELPAPTGWPLALAAGISLLAAGLVTNLAVSLLGAFLFVLAARGWIGEFVPGAGEIHVPLVPLNERPAAVVPAHIPVEHPKEPPGRMVLPTRQRPVWAGVVGGAGGGLVMAALALGYGWYSGKGPWYPVNLLAALAIAGFESETPDKLMQYSAAGLIAGAVIHLVASLAVGLLFGLLLPMLPSRPILWGGVIGPLLWTGAIHELMGILNPVMNRLVDWPWFVASQFGFGLTAGLIVTWIEPREARR